MDMPFFTQFLMISDPMTVGILVLFLIALGYVYFLQKRNIQFGTLVMIATVVGAVLGVAVQLIAGFPKNPMDVVFIKESTKWFSLIGGGFIDLIRMLVIPVVFISIVHVILHMDTNANLKRLVSSTGVVALIMVGIAAIVGLVLGTVTGLGEGTLAVAGDSKMREVKPVVDTLRALIPANPINAMAQTNVIAVVVFGVIIGGVARLVKQHGASDLEVVTKLFDEVHTVIFWVADFVIGLMPYGVVALLATTLAQKGFGAIADMGLFIILIYVGVAIMLVVQAVLLTMFGVSPIMYFRKAKEALILAFTSRSSMGVLPLTVETLTKKLGVNPATANTVASFYRSRIWSAIRLYNVCDERYRDCIRLLRDCRGSGYSNYGSIRILIWYWYGSILRLHFSNFSSRPYCRYGTYNVKCKWFYDKCYCSRSFARNF